MKRNLGKLLFFITLSTSVCSQTIAADKFRFGINTGSMDIDLTSIPETDSNLEFGVGSELFLDYRISRKLWLGGSYARASEENDIKIGDLDGTAGELLEFLDEVVFFGLLNPGIYATVESEVDFYGINAKYFLNSSKRLSVFLSGGLSYWESDLSVSTPGQPTVSDSSSGNGYNYGAGLDWRVGRQWGLSLDLARYDFDEIEITKFVFGLEWSF